MTERPPISAWERFLLGTVIIAVGAGLLIFGVLGGQALGATSPHAGGGRTGAAAPCPHAKTQTARVSCLVRAVRWQQSQTAAISRHTYADQVELGYELGEGLYGVDLHRLGACESTNDPLAKTGSYDGITQQGPGFYLRAENAEVYRRIRVVPAKPYNRPVFVAIANILVAARFIARHGSSEWQCRLDGTVKHGGAYS